MKTFAELVTDRWPELFEQLTEQERRAVVASLGDAWHEGWKPNREDVENLTDLVRGAITREEFSRRNAEAARRHQHVAAAG